MPLMTRDSAIGLAFVVLSALLVIWGLAGKPHPLDDGERIVWAEFRDVASLVHFDRDVRLAGVNVGTVGDVRRVGDHARVELKISPAAAASMRADATAELRPHTLFDGNAFIELHPGSATAPELGDRVIDLAHTRNYVTVDKALRLFDTPTRTALAGALRDLRKSIGRAETKALRETVRASPPLVRSAALAARALQGPSRRELTGSIRGLARTTRSLARASDSIPVVLRDAATTAGAINAADPAFERSLALLPQALVQMRAASPGLQSVVRNLRDLAAELPPGLRELTPTLVALRPTLRRLGPALTRARPLLADLRATLTAGRRAASPTASMLRGLQPTIALAQDTLVPYLRSRTSVGTTTAEALGAMGSSAASTLSPVKNAQEAGTAGGGHVFYTDPSGQAQLGCARFGAALGATLGALGLCTP
jgi:phospholipid/cholesterol/gamma-HCH transport system substrate-binding protein